MKIIFYILLTFYTLGVLAQSIPNLPLRGEGEYKWFFLHIYNARLWADSGDDLYSKSLVLELKYSRNFKGQDIVDQSIKELVSLGATKTELDQIKNKLSEIFPDVKIGDAIIANYDPKNGVTFLLNSTKELGKLTDLNLSKKFLDIWLSEKTSAKDLRSKLLGKNI